MSLRNLILLLLMVIFVHQVVSITFTSRILHRFSEEMKALRASGSTNTSVRVSWPEKGSMEYYQELVSGDFRRQKMKLGSRFQLLFPSEGSKTIALGNDFGWSPLLFLPSPFCSCYFLFFRFALLFCLFVCFFFFFFFF